MIIFHILLPSLFKHILHYGLLMIKAALLDLDGTLFVGKTAIPGAVQTLGTLRSNGVKVFFLTNASTRNRKSTAEKLKGLGFIANESEIFCSSYMVADYIATNHPGKTVFCVSEGGIQDELSEKKIKMVDSEKADIIVVGLDRTLTYEKLAIAHKAIANGALFLATNDDSTFPVENGTLPGSGAMVAAVERSTGKKALIIGKPNRYGIDLLLRENSLKKDEVIIVGDRLETDILTGKRNRIKSALVLTGVAKKEDLEKLKKSGKEKDMPDFVLDSVNDLMGLIKRLNSR